MAKWNEHFDCGACRWIRASAERDPRSSYEWPEPLYCMAADDVIEVEYGFLACPIFEPREDGEEDSHDEYR